MPKKKVQGKKVHKVVPKTYGQALPGAVMGDYRWLQIVYKSSVSSQSLTMGIDK